MLAVSVEPELFDRLAFLESLAKEKSTGSKELANAIEGTLRVFSRRRLPEISDQALLKKSLDCLSELGRGLRTGWKKLRPSQRQDRKEIVAAPVVAKVSSDLVLVGDSERPESIHSMRAALESILCGDTSLLTFQFGSWRTFK